MPIAVAIGADLGAIRNLGRHGVPVIAVSPKARMASFFSRYCKGVVCPDPEESEAEYIDFMSRLGEQMNDKGVIIPCGDEDVLAVTRHRDELSRYYEFPMSKFEIMEEVVNKREFYKKLEVLGFSHPKTYFPDGISDVERISHEITYPQIVKPIAHTKFSRQFHVKLFEANTPDELVEAYDKATSAGYEVVIQEVIPGSDRDLYALCSYSNSASEPVGVFAYRKIRGYPLDFGVSSLVESVFEPEIVELGVGLIQSIGYHGISEIELKRDQRDGKFKIIEMNARTSIEVVLGSRLGVDTIYMAYMDAIGEDVKKVVSKTESIKWLYVCVDIMTCLAKARRGELSFGEWIRSLRGKKVYADFAGDDPIPFIVYAFTFASPGLKILIGKVRSRIRREQRSRQVAGIQPA